MLAGSDQEKRGERSNDVTVRVRKPNQVRLGFIRCKKIESDTSAAKAVLEATAGMNGEPLRREAELFSNSR
jgi:hypothetical protein